MIAIGLILFEQLKHEHAVDIFQCVRALKHQRSGMITSFVRTIDSIDVLLSVTRRYSISIDLVFILFSRVNTRCNTPISTK
jgi:hypothetical protein